ncbi:MFS transporter [Streptomyces sp. NPDC057623]|uniref:MFS transporter n=1 Tax=Streptomyces sp. NPDC057623 TaxID=3346187 RepID=UPI0036A67446
MASTSTFPASEKGKAKHGKAKPDSPNPVGTTVIIAVLGVFVTYLPINGVSGALTTIAQATHANTTELQWVTDSYVIPMAAAVLSGGVFGDLYGRRRVFSLGLILTAIGAVTAGLASLLGSAAVPTLWAGQAVSGLGAGLLLPTTLALIAHAVPDPRARGRYISIWATGIVGGLAAGPLICGAILEFADLGWIFLPTGLLAVTAGVFAHFTLPESKNAVGRQLDWPGQISATIGIASIIFGVIEGGAQGWGSPVAQAGFAVGAVSVAAFILFELRSPAPLMDLRLFRSTGFSVAAFSSLIALFAIVGITFLLSLYLGSGQPRSALEIGLRLIFVPGTAALVSPFAGRLVGMVEPVHVLTAGLVVGAVGTLLLANIDTSTSFPDLAWRLAVFGVSVALMLTSGTVVSVNSAPWHLAGMASAASTAMRQFGGALGPAILGSIYVGQLHNGGSAASGLRAALLTTGVLLSTGAVGCVATVLVSRRPSAET